MVIIVNLYDYFSSLFFPYLIEIATKWAWSGHHISHPTLALGGICCPHPHPNGHSLGRPHPVLPQWKPREREREILTMSLRQRHGNCWKGDLVLKSTMSLRQSTAVVGERDKYSIHIYI